MENAVITNIVGCINLGYSLDLNKMYSENQNGHRDRNIDIEYIPENFPGVRYKKFLGKRTNSALFFNNGKVVISGLKTQAEFEEFSKEMMIFSEKYKSKIEVL